MQGSASATPILDSGVLPTSKPKRSALGVLIGLAIGIAFAVVVGIMGDAQVQGNIAILSYFLILAVVVTIHELGHLLAGWLVGFDFSHISVGPLALTIQYGRLKAQLRRGFGTLGYAGMHIDTVNGLRRRLLIFIAAGPAANLLSGTSAVVFIRFVPRPLGGSWVVPIAEGFSVLSFVIGSLSLVPYGSTVRSDGDRIWMLLTSAGRTRRWIAAAAIASQQRRGVRPKAWKQTWLKAVYSTRDGSVDEFSGNMLAYSAANDCKDVRRAAGFLERCLELLPSAQSTSRDFVAREASVFCGWFRNDAALAERWLAQVKRPKTETPLLRARTGIAIACARGDWNAALAGWKQGAEFIKRLPSTKIKDLLEESWQEWGDEIRLRQSRYESEPEPQQHSQQAGFGP